MIPEHNFNDEDILKRYVDFYGDERIFADGLVDLPEQYRWNSLGYHVQTDNRDNFLSTDFGLKEFNVKNPKERIRIFQFEVLLP